jgi:hypothetical protein
MKHSEYVKVIQKTITDLAIRKILEALLKEAPFLFWGPFGPITKALITKVVMKAYEQGEMLAFFKYIDMRVDAQGVAFTKAAIKNHHIQQHGTEDEKKKAEQELIVAFKSFVKLSN